jgi:hypothetical protein
MGNFGPFTGIMAEKVSKNAIFKPAFLIWQFVNRPYHVTKNADQECIRGNQGIEEGFSSALSLIMVSQ